MLVLKPEVEQVSYYIEVGSLSLNLFQEEDQPFLFHFFFTGAARAQVGVGEKEDFISHGAYNNMESRRNSKRIVNYYKVAVPYLRCTNKTCRTKPFVI